MGLSDDGFARFGATRASLAWAEAALGAALPLIEGAEKRHGGTWAPGVDLLPNAPDGSVGDVALSGDWEPAVGWDGPWHRAQVSTVWPGYPGRDAGESAGAHRYRLRRDAAHVDGLLPVGPERRRFPREFHAFVLGLPLTDAVQAPTVVWRGSHHVVQRHLRDAVGTADPGTVDVTEAYHAARRAVFETCARVELTARAGDGVLLHRLALHGTAPWVGQAGPPRLVAFFRPEMEEARAWLEEA